MEAGILFGDPAIALLLYVSSVDVFTFAIVGVSLFARIVSRFDGKNKWIDRGAFTVCLLSMSLVVGFCLPESWHVQRMMLDELSFLAREKRWDAIVDKYRGKQIHDYVSLNYLNMSLAQKGELADRMFTFDQKGTKSLCADWNQTFYMDRLLAMSISLLAMYPYPRALRWTDLRNPNVREVPV